MVATILSSPDVSIDVLPAAPPSALAIYESLCALGLGTVGSWLDCAARLTVAAARASSPGQRDKLLTRAVDCRSRARRAAVIEVAS